MHAQCFFTNMVAIAYSLWLSLFIDKVHDSIAYINVTNCLVYQLCGSHVKCGPCWQVFVTLLRTPCFVFSEPRT